MQDVICPRPANQDLFSASLTISSCFLMSHLLIPKNFQIFLVRYMLGSYNTFHVVYPNQTKGGAGNRINRKLLDSVQTMKNKKSNKVHNKKEQKTTNDIIFRLSSYQKAKLFSLLYPQETRRAVQELAGQEPS